MAAKTLKSLFTPISVRLRSHKSHDYRLAHSLGFNDDSWASDESVENAITSTPSYQERQHHIPKNGRILKQYHSTKAKS